MNAEKDFSQHLQAVIEIARDAGDAILKVYRDGFDIEYKSDGSPLTAADRAAHEVIFAGLSRLEPLLPILSEESEAKDDAKRKTWTRFWLVDPLDGTKEFINRRDEFTVNIALIDHGVPVLGVVVAPVLGLSYWACKGQGAYRQQADDEPAEINVAKGHDVPIVMVSRLHAGGALGGFLERLGPHELVSMGSSLKLCLVAEGAADVYPRLAPTSEWDTAAAQCIVEEAGGRVVDLDGVSLQYNKDNILNPWFMVIGQDGRDWLSLVDVDERTPND